MLNIIGMSISELNNQTQEILNSFFQYVSEKNIDGITSMLADNIDWYIVKSEQLPWTGRLTDKSQVGKAMELLFDAHVDETGQLEMDHVFIDGTEAAVFGQISRKVKITGKTFTANFCQRFTVKEGRITRFLMLEDAQEILKAF
jgi:ketosteroid isomerase-like protein